MRNNLAKNDVFYTVDEAAALLGIGRNTAYKACANGQIPSIRIGRLFKLRRADIDVLAGKGDSSRVSIVQNKKTKEPFLVFKGKDTVIIRIGDTSFELTNSEAKDLSLALFTRGVVRGKYLSQDEKHLALKLYKETTESVSSIGSRFGVSRQAIQQLLTKEGVSGIRRPEAAARILRLHAEGKMRRRG